MIKQKKVKIMPNLKKIKPQRHKDHKEMKKISLLMFFFVSFVPLW